MEALSLEFIGNARNTTALLMLGIDLLNLFVQNSIDWLRGLSGRLYQA
jgi:hypothetical protein